MFARRIPSLARTRTRLATTTRTSPRTYATATTTTKGRNHVTIVEVGPRDGLQNEKSVIPPELKVELINRLNDAGMRTIEAGSFVSPKWVPQVRFHTLSLPLRTYDADTCLQMAGTAEVITRMERRAGNHYPVLVPNLKGLENLLELLCQHSSSPSPSSSSSRQQPPPTDEIAIFTAATDAFCRANTNCTVAESLARLEAVTTKAREHGLRVRGCVPPFLRAPSSVLQSDDLCCV